MNYVYGVFQYINPILQKIYYNNKYEKEKTLKVGTFNKYRFIFFFYQYYITTLGLTNYLINILISSKITLRFVFSAMIF